MIIILSCQAFQPRAEIHVVADNRVIHLFAQRAHIPDHHVPGVDPDANVDDILALGRPLCLQLL